MKADDELITHYIEQNPQKPSRGEARLVDFGVPVWALIGYLNGVDGDIDQTARDYDVPQEAIKAALAYYRRHRHLIDARLEANAAHLT